MNFHELEELSRLELDSLGTILKNEFEYTKIVRRDKEVEWVQNLRQYRGQYDPEILLKIHKNASQVFPKYTRFWLKKWKAILQNIVLPDNDKNWGISPTPKPMVDVKDLQNIIDQLEKSQVEATPENIEKAVYEFAKARCRNMELEIEDQLSDIKYEIVIKDTIDSGLKFGTGIVKGTMSKKDTSNEIVSEGGVFKQVTKTIHVPYIENVRIWDYYPDMGTTDKETVEFEWERMVLTKHQLRELADKEGFFGDLILQHLKENPKGDAKYEQWEIDLQAMDINKFKDMRTNKYEVYVRHGYLDIEEMKYAGITVDEENVEFEVMSDVWILGSRVIKVEESPFLEPLYHLFYFEKDETSIFGSGLPKITRDSQQTLCSAIRMSLDNGAICAAPQAEVNIELLDQGEDPDDFRPRRIWKRFGRGIDAQIPAIRAIEFNSHIPELLSIVDKAEKIAEMEISFSMYPQEEMETPTRQNLAESSMKASSKVITIKDVVKAFDDCNKSVIKALYDWNMEYNKKEHIKGDFNVEAKGVATLLSKEILTQRVGYFSQTLSPEERMYIKTGEFLRQKAKILDLDVDEWLRTDEEVQKMQESSRDAEMEAIMKAKAKSDVAYTDSKAAHMNAKAEKAVKDSDLDVINTLKGSQ